MNILALDLGTNLGWSQSDGSGGTLRLISPKEVTAQRKLRGDRRLDVRVPRLWNHLTGITQKTPLEWLVWEDVLFSSTTMQCQLWSSLRTTCWLFSHLHGIRTECLNTASLKLFSTGHGGATKDMMAAHLIQKHPHLFYLESGHVKKVDGGRIVSEDEVDAAHLLLWAEQTLKT